MIRRSGHLETEKKDLSLGLGVANKICGRWDLERRCGSSWLSLHPSQVHTSSDICDLSYDLSLFILALGTVWTKSIRHSDSLLVVLAIFLWNQAFPLGLAWQLEGYWKKWERCGVFFFWNPGRCFFFYIRVAERFQWRLTHVEATPAASSPQAANAHGGAGQLPTMNALRPWKTWKSLYWNMLESQAPGPKLWRLEGGSILDDSSWSAAGNLGAFSLGHIKIY